MNINQEVVKTAAISKEDASRNLHDLTKPFEAKATDSSAKSTDKPYDSKSSDKPNLDRMKGVM